MRMRERLLVLGVVLLALWPRLAWYRDRLSGGGGLLVLLPLLVAAGFALREARAHAGAPIIRCGILLTAAGLIAHAFAYHPAPLLISGGIAVMALTAALSGLFLGRLFHHGIGALLMLSLPVTASLNFYLGYPLRLFSAKLAIALMIPTGIIPEITGTCLKWGDQLVFIDAPCGGVQMLWTAGVLTASLICWLRLSLGRSMLLGIAAFLIVLASNGFRTAALFFLEVGGLPIPARLHDCFHSGAGLVIFAGAAILILLLALRLADRSAATEPPPQTNGSPHPRGARASLGACMDALTRPIALLLLLATLASAAVPLLKPPASVPETAPFPGWPRQFEGRALTQLPPDKADLMFGDDFPGQIGRFTDGESTVVIRWVDRPTRTLHRPAVCFEAFGYQLDYQPMHVDEAGTQWSRFDATREGTTLAVRVQIIDATGQTWPDSSSWYWAATSGRSTGPWWAFTIASPVVTP
jgi:exosortase/archaeosortase family protein